MQMWKRSFDLKPIPRSKVQFCCMFLWSLLFISDLLYDMQMHSKYQHPNIQLFMMGSKSTERSTGEMIGKADSTDETTQRIGTSDEKTRFDQKISEDDTAEPQMDWNTLDNNRPDDPASEGFKDDDELLEKLKSGDLSEWEARRYGSMAARLLRDVKIT